MTSKMDVSRDAVQGRFGHPAYAPASGGRLLRRTFVIALILVSGGLISSGVLELFFRYRESVETIEALQREMAQGAAFKIQQFVRDIEKTLRASTQAQEIIAAGLTEAYRFELIKLLKVAPAITEVVGGAFMVGTYFKQGVSEFSAWGTGFLKEHPILKGKANQPLLNVKPA